VVPPAPLPALPAVVPPAPDGLVPAEPECPPGSLSAHPTASNESAHPSAAALPNATDMNLEDFVIGSS
jgi:hypothetical protein